MVAFTKSFLLLASLLQQPSWGWVNNPTSSSATTLIRPTNIGLVDPMPFLSSSKGKKKAPWTVEQAESLHGMPWTSSIDPTHDEAPYFMEFWKYQLEFMKSNLTNLRVIPAMDQDFTQDLSYACNDKTSKRMITLCFASDEYRLIRLTLMDAGKATQVFTSVWYPRGNLPIMAADLLRFEKANRHLTVLDYQPIHDSEEEHDEPYEHVLDTIRQGSPNLQEVMTDRFYDHDRYFSNQPLLGRNPDPQYIWDEVFPAYKACVENHVTLAKQHKTTTPEVLRKQAGYDDYSAERDPAHGLLSGCFGKDFADKFVYDVLFPLSSQNRRGQS